MNKQKRKDILIACLVILVLMMLIIGYLLLTSDGDKTTAIVSIIFSLLCIYPMSTDS